MLPFSIESRDQISVKSYGFLSFFKNIGKNVSKNLKLKWKLLLKTS